MSWHKIGIIVGVILVVLLYLGFPEQTGETPEARGPASSPAPVAESTDQPPEPASQPSSMPVGDWKPPSPAAADERVADRLAMVRQQMADPGDGRIPVRDPRVLEAMRAVPRHEFVSDDTARLAYRDSPLPIGHGQTISQPYIVAIMTELLQLGPGEKVLEIGTGSGYQAAVLAHLTPHVYTIEIIKPLADEAMETFKAQGYDSVRCRWADGYFGWPEAAPFDAIIVTCAAGHLPDPLWQQLKPGGRILIPIGGAYEVQRLVVMEKKPDGERVSETVMMVRFVPLTRTIIE